MAGKARFFKAACGKDAFTSPRESLKDGSFKDAKHFEVLRTKAPPSPDHPSGPRPVPPRLRYSLVREHGKRWRRWQLVIRNTRADDQGQYRCQVATQPPLILVVNLNVTVPVARVVDERGTKVQEKHYNSGSMIELKCIVDQVPFPHGPVTWRRGATILTYNTSRGGISVKGNEAGGFIRSRLYVADATPQDSGFYSCWYKNITSDTVTVHVIAGENSAAMQHDGLPGSGGNVSGGPSSLQPSLALPSLLALVTVASWVLSSSCTASFITTGTSTFVNSVLFPEGITWSKQQKEHEEEEEEEEKRATR
ncbi:hypothetical protein O3P69_018614 [Scylla paramamosain]|uniref:Ig-like domain-containing protein n=1 Tax=Scylla paramamosain TaxID=85552 RepID=A0AAW0T2S0_SCYPA